MATASFPHRWKYDVFVSFRGEDIRRGFIDHLFNDFKQKGIHAFRDDRELPNGEEIFPHLYNAIEEIFPDGIPVSVPTVAPQGLQILLVDAATQTEDEESPRLL
ncbi:NB-ARC domains-containing protein, partial [Tanacetum coccineum]